MKPAKLNIIFNFSLKLLFLFSLSHLAGIDTKSCSAQNLKEGAGAYKTGNYRNLFKEIGRTEKEIDVRIEKKISIMPISMENQLKHPGIKGRIHLPTIRGEPIPTGHSTGRGGRKIPGR